MVGVKGRFDIGIQANIHVIPFFYSLRNWALTTLGCDESGDSSLRLSNQEDPMFVVLCTSFIPSGFVSNCSFGRSLKRSLNRSKCGRVMIVYLTNFFTQSTKRSRLPPGATLFSISAGEELVRFGHG